MRFALTWKRGDSDRDFLQDSPAVEGVWDLIQGVFCVLLYGAAYVGVLWVLQRLLGEGVVEG